MINDTGDGIQANESLWTFGGKAAEVFNDHVRRSIPLYDIGHDIVCGLSDFFIRKDSVVYEIGVSTGELLRRLAERHHFRDGVHWIGIDIEPDMIQQALTNLSDLGRRIDLERADVVTHNLHSTDLVISYYCLQFVCPKSRQHVVDNIYQALERGGAFILFEKVRAADARFQDILSQMYLDFKLSNHYDPAEIIAKSRSLKGVLEPFSTFDNERLLRAAGFVDISPVFRYLCFEGMLAIK